MTGTSDDFLTWTEPQFLDYPDAPPEHLYTNAVQPYPGAPHILIGFPTRFLPATQQTEPTFMVSRDGTTFHRYAEAVIPHDGAGQPRRQPQQLHGLGPGATARRAGTSGRSMPRRPTTPARAAACGGSPIARTAWWP